jgi:hypothetical protein
MELRDQMGPVIPDRLFDDIDTLSAQEVERRFAPLVLDGLHPNLNGLTSLSDLQTVRLKWKSRTGSQDAFGSFKADPRHWYTFNHGGRCEAQFNVGMFPDYVRVGLGFEFTEKQGGDPSAVTLSYTVFRNLISESTEFAQFVNAHHLEVEYFPTANGTVGHAPTSAVVGWEPSPSPPIQWIFFGRLLRRGIDRHILEDKDAFGNVLNSVLGAFKPFWRRAQEQAAKLK